MGRCLDEETIQRLLDDELPAPLRRKAEEHFGGCHPCAASLREAGREEAFISSFFAPQLFEAVPTERLWAGILGALSGEGPSARCK